MTTETPFTWFAARFVVGRDGAGGGGWRRRGRRAQGRRVTVLATESYTGSAPDGYNRSLGAAPPAPRDSSLSR